MRILIPFFIIINLILFFLILHNIGIMEIVRWNSEKTELLIEEGKVPNMVSTIYMKNRIFDTLFEVLVFSIAVFGVKLYHVSKERNLKEIEDKNHRFLSRYFSFLAMLVSIYLAITGHISPGGGFSAGVAGGTAILLLGISMGVDEMEKRFDSIRIEQMEKILIIIMIMLTFLEYRFDFQYGNFGEMLSGALIPIQSLIIYMKVLAGAWIIIYNFMKHRGIL